VRFIVEMRKPSAQPATLRQEEFKRAANVAQDLLTAQPGFGLAIGVTSYDGGVYYGITADRDALPDVEILGNCVIEALDELVDSARADRPRAPRGRRKPQS